MSVTREEKCVRWENQLESTSVFLVGCVEVWARLGCVWQTLRWRKMEKGQKVGKDTCLEGGGAGDRVCGGGRRPWFCE